jgi:hypothetical protein
MYVDVLLVGLLYIVLVGVGVLLIFFARVDVAV